MDIHNTSEDIVYNTVHKIFDDVQKNGNPEGLCLCYQCRVDTICFALNRVAPHYIVSNRGLSRIETSGINHQQTEADITTLVYKGLRLVNHNLRPTAPHDGTTRATFRPDHPVYDIPTISGRIFNGISFEPVTNIEVCLYCDGELVQMRNNNWQNPCQLVPSTPGVFSFWPAPVVAHAPDIEQTIKYAIKVKSPDYEPLNHFFNITATSKFHNSSYYVSNRNFKLPDLYIFPPGDEEEL